MADSLEPRESPGLLLWRATLSWQRVITSTLKPLGLTHVQFVLLASAWWLTRVAGERPNQRRIAEHANTDAMMTSQVIRALAEKNLLVRTTDPDDARAHIIDVTDDGVALALRAVQVVEEADRLFFESAGDRSALMAVLTALNR
ncbi:MAG: winged helix-turn-helix transcriptional regulator [Microbacterium ginsengisoli]|uniref:MarR family winged helix-turn-helix transcriptional regulator n=1 Tax=Microbacterium TaxID=33882 RepID=UPI0006F94466|nr:MULTISPECIES: MarR family winged helix-turn-helix transcriptional regulator [unclassified Microbacterium]MBN9198355.1 winged helix-turn-helix transcriptional regulator [Microbacterium ginsengisoli]KQR94003.1 MarR family transcriptional regulator [Microbacterium sp. Leaf347]KQR97136.1 MarR family transcriptional regulator [Microbacterium sp. Leaf351]ODU79955.1 MAG: MarR family transcriptional regulator [Microbacterium sp. SCN 71-21]OJU78226.1 MAG: MarR family transcriptional regulator [Micro